MERPGCSLERQRGYWLEVEGTGVIQKEESLKCTTATSVPCLSQVGSETRDKSQEKLDDCKAMEEYPYGICIDQCRKFLLDLGNRSVKKCAAPD